MDRNGPSSADANPGVSLRMGPVKTIDISAKANVNGMTNGKRKSRTSATNGKSYKESSASDDNESDKPLVRHEMFLFMPLHTAYLIVE